MMICRPKEIATLWVKAPGASITVNLHPMQRWDYSVISNGIYRLERKNIVIKISECEFKRCFDVYE